MNLNKIFSKLPRTELNAVSEKVELATMKDLDKVASLMKKLSTDVNDSISNMEKAKADLDNAIDESINTAYRAEKEMYDGQNIMKELEIQAKELGVDPFSLKEFKDFVTKRDLMGNYLNDLRRVADRLSD
tara:strand:+ start:321 stop:710 length:390 start_codon:yes stop_codon:yes gene_type:complete